MATTMVNRRADGVLSYAPARARWATVRVETEGGTYVGRMYVPETKKRVSDVLCDDRPFVSLIDVSINGANDVESFVAVNKNYIRTIRIVSEGVPEEPKPRRLD